VWKVAGGCLCLEGVLKVFERCLDGLLISFPVLEKNRLYTHSTDLIRTPCAEKVCLYRPRSLDNVHTEIVWLVSSYVHYVWEMVYGKKVEVKLDKFFGFMTFRLKMYQATSPNQRINLHYT